MTPALGINIGPSILKALGLEGRKVRGLDIRIRPKEAVTVVVEELLINSHSQPFVNALAEYVLLPKPSIMDNFDDWFEAAKARANA